MNSVKGYLIVKC